MAVHPYLTVDSTPVSTESLMHLRRLTPFAFLLVAACGNSEAPATGGGGTTPPPPDPTQFVSVLTQHNDNNRSGWNDTEKELTTANVNVQHFGLVFTLLVDDQVYAQPLVAGHVLINGTYRNI